MNTISAMHIEVLDHRGGKHRSRSASALFRAKQKLSEARSELEEIMFTDHPSASTDIYYGNRS